MALFGVRMPPRRCGLSGLRAHPPNRVTLTSSSSRGATSPQSSRGMNPPPPRCFSTASGDHHCWTLRFRRSTPGELQTPAHRLRSLPLARSLPPLLPVPPHWLQPPWPPPVWQSPPLESACGAA
eukprot:2781169-Prymnesium_polylepis.1